MTLKRELLEQYLDGELHPAQSAEIERHIESDAAAHTLVEQLRRERALRAAALSTYAPQESETASLADRMLEAMRDQPAGVIRPQGTPWWKRFGAIAAALLIAAGSFYAGQMSVPKPTTTLATGQGQGTERTWVVEVRRTDGDMTRKEFTSYAEAQKFAEEMAQSVAQVADSGGGVL